ncbi:MAG: flippase [Syntrophaceae bacterium]|nr:flippase [Syntrophaceae bacterium]
MKEAKNSSGNDSEQSHTGPKNRSRYILINTLSSYGRDLVDTIAFLVLIPFIIQTLGKEAFGLWSLIWSFLAIFELADFGFAASVIKYIADARGRQDTMRLKKLVSTLFWIYVVLGTIVMMGIALSLFFFNQIFQIPPDQTRLANIVLLILGVRSALYLPLGMFRGVLVGYQKMTVANIYKALANIVYLVATIIFLTLSPDIIVLAIVNMITGLIPMFAMMIHVKRIAPDLSIHPRHFEKSFVRELTSFSLYFSLIQMAGMIASRADALIIKLFLPLEMVGIYSIGMRLSEKATTFCSHLTRALSPVFAELHGAGDQSNVRATLYMGSKITTAFSMPLLLGLGILSEPLIVAWTGPDFKAATPVCQWLVGAAMLGIIHGNSVNLLSMGGYQKFVALSIFAGQILNIILSFLFIKSHGITGVAFATFLSTFPIYVFLIQMMVSKVHQQSIWSFYIATLAPSLIPALAMSAFFAAVLRFHALTNLVEVAILELLGAIIFGACFWIIGFRASERAYLKDKIGRALIRRRKL